MTPHQEKIFNARLKQIDGEIPGYRNAFLYLEETILAAAGGDALVVLPWPCDYLIELLEDGYVQEGRVRKTYGRPSQCHDNVASQWLKKRFSAIGTGFGLSGDDGLWREHSWGLCRNGTIVETTEPRTSYFGVKLIGEAALEFTEGAAV